MRTSIGRILKRRSDEYLELMMKEGLTRKQYDKYERMFEKINFAYHCVKDCEEEINEVKTKWIDLINQKKLST